MKAAPGLIPAVALSVLGLAQMAGDLLGVLPLKGLAAATSPTAGSAAASAPAPSPVNNSGTAALAASLGINKTKAAVAPPVPTASSAAPVNSITYFMFPPVVPSSGFHDRARSTRSDTSTNGAA